MKRIPFSQIIKNTQVDIRREYDRLFSMLYVQETQNDITLRDFCSNCFSSLPFRGTCISLDDFDDFYGYHFTKKPQDFNLDYLVSFCEYSYNLVYHSKSPGNVMFAPVLRHEMELYLQQVMNVVESIGYMKNKQGLITDFVPKDQTVISVAEIVDPNLSYKVLEYNHHLMKGDLERKKATLLVLADKLEPMREKLKQINSSLESDIFFLLNEVQVRHNNREQGSKKYNPFIAGMEEKTIEQWYDDMYQMCLLAFLELEHLDRKNRIVQLKKDILNKA